MKRYLFDRFKLSSAGSLDVPSFKQCNISGILLAALIFLFSHSVQPAFSDTVSYEYNNLGRLTKTVSSGGAIIVYEYDAAGRVISTTRKGANRQLPVLTGITPDNALIGGNVNITIQGANLLTTKNVSADDPGIRIMYFSSNENSVSISAQIQDAASTGPAVFTVETLYGTASISLNLIRLTFTPAQMLLITGASENITARIEGLTGDYNLVLTNNNPLVILAPQTLLVPFSGSATFALAAVSKGNAVISAGDSAITAFVSDPFVGLGTAISKPVSVIRIDQYLAQGVSVSLPVSVWPGFIWGNIVSDHLVSVKIGFQ